MTPEATSMKISIGGDHAGFPLKATVIAVCKDLGHEVTDHGCHDETPVDFPDITRQVCADVLNGKAERAILVCGTGVGASIAANKIPGIRASIVHDGHIAHQCVEHDDVNVMCIGAKIVGPWLAVDLVRGYLAATFSTDEDCRRRVAKLMELERSYSKAAAE
jgi:ribose 5-phosphate isomerase B